MKTERLEGWLDKQVSIVKMIGQKLLMKHEGVDFFIDEENKKLMEFLIYYFNGDERALDVYPEKEYRLQKSIMIYGDFGVGKNTLMDVFQQYIIYSDNLKRNKADYLGETHVDNKELFASMDKTELCACYKKNNDFKGFSFNHKEVHYPGEIRYIANPKHMCLNDLGYNLKEKNFGNEMVDIMNCFLMARYEIYRKYGKKTHVTTNHFMTDLKINFFSEDLWDRSRTLYNILYMAGKSKRR